MLDLLADSPLLLLFVVAALGYPLGRIKIAGFSLGVAAVLFVGLAIGALDERLRLPELVYVFGLVLFVYPIGLASGAGFFASLRRQGLRDNAFILVMLLVAAGLAAAAHRLLGLSASHTAGLYAGSLTNTPALAGVIEALKGRGVTDPALAEPVVAYSLAYPFGVLGVIAAIALMQRWFKVDYAREARDLRDLGASGEHLETLTVRVTRPDIDARSIDGWRKAQGWRVIFGRYRRGDTLALVHGDTVLKPGDLVTVIGARPDLAAVAAFLGEASDEHLEFDHSQLDFRRVFVSNPEVANKRLRDLRLPQRFGALVTRVRRGDIDLLPSGDTRLELGDRVRVVARRERIPELSKFFGDSYKALSEIDVMTFGFGVAVGLMLGALPIPLPGGASFKLGFAGGPLVVALVLGALGRTGPIVWQLPYSANLTLRQLGLILFLAGIGTRSGHAFVTTLGQGGGLALFAAGAVITWLTALVTLVIGYRLLRIPMSLLIGMLAGLQTQPAVLAYAGEQTGNDLVNIGYATVYPLAMIAKILLAQALVLLL